VSGRHVGGRAVFLNEGVGVAVKGKNGQANGAANGNRVAALVGGGQPAGGGEVHRGVVIPRPKILNIRLTVRGITPLIVCRMDQKTQDEMRAKTEGKAKNAKEAKDPEREWNAARWVSTDGWDGIHAAGVRAAVISAARSVDGLTMTELKQAIFVNADGYSAEGVPLVRIDGKARCFTNICRTTTGVAYPRHRPKYDDWKLTLNLTVNGHILSEEQAANLVALAGAFSGLGEWRPTAPKSMTGDFGRFEIVEA